MNPVKDKDNQIDLLKAMLRKIKTDGPVIKQLVLQSVNGELKTTDELEISGEIIRRLKIQNKKLQEQVTSLREQLKKKNRDINKVLARMNTSEKRTNSLALALGSCDHCWGEDADCIHCAGNGTPGWRKINRRLYIMYVLPMLEKKFGLNTKIK
jgi:hypothetical protein